MFSKSPALTVRDRRGLGVRMHCRCYDSFFSKTMKEYSLLSFEDRMMKSVTTEHRLPLPMYVWMYIQGPHLPVAVDATNISNLSPPLEVCSWGIAAASPRGACWGGGRGSSPSPTGSEPGTHWGRYTVGQLACLRADTLCDPIHGPELQTDQAETRVT